MWWNFIWKKKKLNKLRKIFYNSIKTRSEQEYELLEPWIQWVSIYTGKTAKEHGVFRLGDIVNSMVVLQFIKKYYPASKIDWIVEKKFKGVLDNNPHIDQIRTTTTALRQLNETVDLPRHFGFLMYWHVIGPFDNTKRSGFDKIYPPEKTIDFDAVYEGKNGKAQWSKFVTADQYGMVNINKAYPGPGDGLKEVTAYAYTEYEASEAREAELRLGCKNAWKIWHNGNLIFGRDEYHRGMRIDQYKLKLKLAKGRNTLLI